MSSQTLRQRYVADAVTTVSPARLITMLYDGLVSDLLRAEQAVEGRDRMLANERLLHAQAIVTELRVSLDPGKWDGGPALAELYDFINRELIDANVNQDVDKIRSCHGLDDPLREAWHEAAAQVGALAATP
jgi:flagellar protein FliS